MDVQEEARRLHALFATRPADLVAHLSHQIGTVKTYAQVLVGLCGLTITVTGFSGAHMIRSGSLAAGLMVTGIALVLIGLVFCIRTITLLRWVSQELRDDLVDTAIAVIQRRNHQQRMLAVAAVFVVAGLASYLGAVTVAALIGGANFAGP
ncbi:MAG: hypothetical protein NT062_08320 [Proteobacteria bacterium]|nr:hypothetical protein [Pseudomonadota bacterium]